MAAERPRGVDSGSGRGAGAGQSEGSEREPTEGVVALVTVPGRPGSPELRVVRLAGDVNRKVVPQVEAALADLDGPSGDHRGDRTGPGTDEDDHDGLDQDESDHDGHDRDGHDVDGPDPQGPDPDGPDGPASEPPLGVVDLTSLRYLDDRGVRALFAVADRFAAAGRTLHVVAGAGSESERVARIMQLETFVAVHGALDDVAGRPTPSP